MDIAQPNAAVTEEGVFLLAPDAPGLGLKLDEAVAAQNPVSS